MFSVLFMGGSSSIVVGFSFASQLGCEFHLNMKCVLFINADPGTAASTLSLIIMGLVVLFCGGIYEVRTKRDALFPVTAFKDPTASKPCVHY
jgi:hypothetical protein